MLLFYLQVYYPGLPHTDEKTSYVLQSSPSTAAPRAGEHLLEWFNLLKCKFRMFKMQFARPCSA